MHPHSKKPADRQTFDAPSVPRLLYGVCGYPLGQTLSPLLHTWAFARLGHPAAYLAWPQPQHNLPALIAAVRMLPIAGLSLTIPHKEAVIPLLDALTPAARSIGAVNTLFWQNEELWGDNTDLAGFLAPLAQRPCALALVLGGGGAARAVVAGLTQRGARVFVAVRDPAKAAELRNDFPCTLIPWEERLQVRPEPGAPFWVINTTPLGMRGKAEQETPYPAQTMSDAAKAAGDPGLCLAYDLVYNPLQTRFLGDAARSGWASQDGLDMFVGQGAAQSAIWTGQSWPAAMLREARDLLLASFAGA